LSNGNAKPKSTTGRPTINEFKELRRDISCANLAVRSTSANRLKINQPSVNN